MSDIYQEGHAPCQRCGVIVPWFELKSVDSWQLCNYCYQERLDEKRARCEKCREIIYDAGVHSKGVLLCDNCARSEKAASPEFSQEPGKPVERDYSEPPPWPFGQRIRVAEKGFNLFSGVLERILVTLKIKKKVELRPRVKLRVPEKKKKLGKAELLELMSAIEKEKSKGDKRKKRVKGKEETHTEFKQLIDEKKDQSEKKK